MATDQFLLRHFCVFLLLLLPGDELGLFLPELLRDRGEAARFEGGHQVARHHDGLLLALHCLQGPRANMLHET